MQNIRAFVVIVLMTFTTAAVAQAELTLWFEGPAEQVAFMQEAVTEYNDLQTDAAIQLVEIPDSRERIATALASGQGPDMLWHNHNIPWFYGIEAVYPLNEFVLDPEIGIGADQLFPAVRETAQYGGVVMGIPIFSFPGALMYNRAIFEEAGLNDEDAPTTWAEVEELANELTVRDDNGRTTQWGLVNYSIDWMLQEILLSNGGDWVNDDLTQYISCRECLVDGLQWWDKLLSEDEVMPVPSGVTWTGSEAMQSGAEAFVRGDAAMVGFVGTANAAGFLDENPNLDIGVVPTPLGPSANGVRTISPGYEGLHIINGTEDPREAYLFIKWFFEEKALDFARIAPGSVPSTVAALEDPEFRDDPLLGRVIEAMQAAELRSFHNFPGRLDVRSEEPGMAESVLLQQATPEEAVERFVKHAERVFQIYSTDLQEFAESQKIVW